MGYSSYLCKHCDKGIVDVSATDKGINEWMAHVVMMTKNGSRMVEPEFGGYSGHYERFCEGAVWVHNACWEVAGKPEFDAYEGPSGHDPEQGSGSYCGSLDIIDPRITDEAERARLLAEGIEARTQRRFNTNARIVDDWTDQEDSDYHREKHNGEMFRQRWSYFETGEYDDDHNVTRPKDGTMWHVSDKLDNELPEEDRRFDGTEDELKAHLTARWNAFLESDEHAAYLVHREGEVAKYRAEELEKYKTEGRFQTTYGPKRDKEGKEIWPVHQVQDKLRYKTDGEWFHGDGAKTRCAAKAKTLNKAWAAAGYPRDFDHELFVEANYDDEGDDE
jgi:hypothetical protein